LSRFKVECVQCGNVVTMGDNRGGRGNFFCRCGRALYYRDARRVMPSRP
jgi:hypothetical protein